MPSTLSPRASLAAAGALLIALTLALSATAHGATLPVPYSTLAAGQATLANPVASPPGANNFSCRPSAAHPDPVVLVHGLGANMADNWNTMSPLLANHGYCVFALTYGGDDNEPYVGGLEAMQDSAPQLGTFVAHVLDATGATQVDLVGHSEGTVMPRYWMEFDGGAKYVARYVMLTPLWNGTDLLGASQLESLASQFGLATGVNALIAGPCGSCTEFLTGSSFLTKLNGAGMALPGVAYTDIVTKYDELVEPYTSGIIQAPNVTNIVLQNQCPIDYTDHVAAAFDPVAGQDILNALDPSDPGPVPCTLVLPGIGAPQAGTGT